MKARSYLLTLLVTLLGSGCASRDPIQPLLDDMHKRFTYVSDVQQYGTLDKWVASYTGDCEDFALMLQHRLWDEYGLRGDIIVVLTRQRRAHAVLMLNKRAYDNIHPFAFTLEEAGYIVQYADPVPNL